MRRPVILAVLVVIGTAGIVFGAADRIDWLQGWLLLGAYTAIFYHTPEQKAAATASKEKLEKSGKYRRSIVTQIVPASTFWRAEEYHQRYLEKRGLSSCQVH